MTIPAVLVLLAAMSTTPVLAQDAAPSRPAGLSLILGGGDANPSESDTGLTFTTPLDGTAIGFGDGASGLVRPCLGLGAAEVPLSACLTAGGMDPTPSAAGFGLHYGYDGWLSLGAGFGVESFGDREGASSGLTWSPSSAAGRGIAASGERLSGGVNALVDVNALTGLALGGVRPFVGAGLSVGQVHATTIATEDGGFGLALADSTARGLSWGATVGSNYAVGSGVTLDFAYRLAGQSATGPLSPGLNTRSGLGLSGGGDNLGGDSTSHGMSIGLRLSF